MMIKKWIDFWKKETWDQKLILFLLVMAMAILWPLCLVRETTESCFGNSKDMLLEPLEPGHSVTQDFTAVHRRLAKIAYVLAFDPEQPLVGEFLLEIMNASGEVVYSTPWPFNLTPDYRYCDIDVDIKVKKGEKYTYRLTNVSVTGNVPQVIYSGQVYGVDGNYGLRSDGQILDGEAWTRFIWSVPLKWKKIIYYWGFLGTAAFAAMEFCKVARRKWEEIRDKKNHSRK